MKKMFQQLEIQKNIEQKMNIQEKNARTVAETSLHLMKPIYPSQFL